MKIQQHELLSCIIRETARAKAIEQFQIQEETKVGQASISNFYTLKTIPRLDTFIKIAEAVGLKVTLIDDSEDIDQELILKNAIKRLEKLTNKIVM